MKYFYATLDELQTEIAIWIRNYFPELRVTKSDENRLILAIESGDDIRLVAEKVGSTLIRLEMRSYEELQPTHKQSSRLAHQVYKKLVCKIDETWYEPDELPHGESDRTAERTLLPIALQTNIRTLHSLDSRVDGDTGPDYEVTRQQLTEERQKLEQRLNHLRQELDEIFSEATLPSATPVLGDSAERLRRTYDQRGMNASTEAKVREAHRQLKAGTKWSVVRKNCSYETYMRWCYQVTKEEPITRL